MRIEAFELARIQIPFRAAFTHAKSERSHTDALILAAYDDAGNVGYGEILPRPYVTGETIQSVGHDIADDLLRPALGVSLADQDHVVAHLRDRLAGTDRKLAALCGYESAILDLGGTALGFSVAALIAEGRPLGPALPPGVVIGFETATDKLAKYCAVLRMQKRRHIKVKVGHPDDIARVQTVSEVFGPDVPIRLDANAAWTADQAVQTLARLRGLPIASIEQPVPREDLAGLRTVRQQSGVKVMADESLCSLTDARRLVDEAAADIFNIRVGKCGGLLASARLVDFALGAGVEVHLGTLVGETGVLSRAGELLGRARDGFACLDGKGQNAFLLAKDILVGPPDEASWDAPGLGITVDPQRIREHQIESPARFESA